MTERVTDFPNVPDLQEGENWMEDGLDEDEDDIPESFLPEEGEEEEGGEGGSPEQDQPEPAAAEVKSNPEPENTAELDSVLERLHGAMIDLMEMQTTYAYKELVRELKAQIERSKALLLSIDKPKDVIRQQEFVKCITFVMETVKKPVDEYMEFLRQHPLFASTEDLSAARWEEDTWTAVFV